MLYLGLQSSESQQLPQEVGYNIFIFENHVEQDSKDYCHQSTSEIALQSICPSQQKIDVIEIDQ